MRKLRELTIFILLGLIFIVLIQGIDTNLLPPPALKNYFLAHGVKETGAINLVSSIYLGYRVFDTLGETIVLFLAVSGISMLLGGRK